MSTEAALKAFEECGVLTRGQHIVYTSGRHGADYINKDALYPQPAVISSLCRMMAEPFKERAIDVVLAPALGGIILTQWLAHHLAALSGRNVLAVFAEKADSPEGFVLKRGYEKLVHGKRTLIAEDVLTTGGSVRKVVQLAIRMGAQVEAVTALCNRGAVDAQSIGAPELFNLTQFQLESWEPETCPLCQKGVPISRTLGKGI